MRCRLRHITRFLFFLGSGEVSDLATVGPKHLSDFVRSQIHLKPKTLAVIVSDLRSFMRFLCMEGVVGEDLSEHVPKVRVPRGARIASVWSSEDVNSILTAVDRSSPKGKRDYAILMLACRLGMRVSDIRNLRLENLHWREHQVEIQQTKTGVTVTLPLTEEVGQAIVDYLQHGRPTTNCREVFLRVNAPIEPFANNDNLHHIITFYRQRAKVGLKRTGRKGMHSLRHSVATRLLEVGTPLETIASVLGHVSLESTQLYAKVDIDALRSAALDPEATNE
jgi:site-specific recombinase XerD